MKKLIVTFAFFVLAFLPTNARAEKVVIAFAVWPPYTMTENGQPSGIDIEIARELCRRVGIESEFQEFPWIRALNYLENGKADALLTPKQTEEREKFMYYPSEPIRIEKRVILVPKGSGIKITKLDDLKDKNIGVVRGYAYSPEFDNYQGVKKTVCDDDQQLVTILAKKRVSIIAAVEEVSAIYLCKKAGIEVEVAYVLGGTPTYIAFSKKSLGEKGKALAEKFGEALKKLKEEGFIEKVQSKYF